VSFLPSPDLPAHVNIFADLRESLRVPVKAASARGRMACCSARVQADAAPAPRIHRAPRRTDIARRYNVSQIGREVVLSGVKEFLADRETRSLVA
jgi:hypothetical protein